MVQSYIKDRMIPTLQDIPDVVTFESAVDLFPRDLPRNRVMRILRDLGFRLVCQKNNPVFRRDSDDGGEIPLTLPNRSSIESSILRTMLTKRTMFTKADISREELPEAYAQS